ncbi:PIN-like domain-containing protein [Oleiagrimonas sp. MCCC 1A03011]|uniref:PIN-like domain-containing protein n=1 Tax=Oleiagrimonas sp. MCCC 1A03011 TaxID=1926883 RepID=UPI000DC3AA11|nr:PIN-like domain-containing protein [Oleiagrimonas sp. MCCC 1A03011]RAP55658.1 histidine kinase [Oleiagrimonas sp. MCCC 1A03011]
MLETLLKIHKDLETLDFKEVWKDGIFVFDSNVLLDLYRLPEPASSDLIKALSNEEFNKKVWIGFQVILEFLSNRYEAISDQKNKFNTVRGLIDEAITQYDEVFENLSKQLDKLRLKQRHSLIDPDKFITQDNIIGGRSFLEEFVDELSVLENKQSDVNDEDKIKDIVLGIFDGKIGEGFTKKELEEIYKLGEKRYENNVPPGYKDKAKQGSYKVEDREFVRKYGDLILWKEILRKASSENIPHIVLVTGDVKEDWWLEKRGKKLGPRKELLNEMYSEAPNLKTFYLYDTSIFLKYAKSELRLDISDSSISQAKDLIERVRRNRFAREEGYIFIPEFIKSPVSQMSGFRVGIGRSVYNLPPVKIKESAFYSALIEIFQNAIEHGIQNYVGVQAKKRGGVILLRFKNKVSPTSSGREDNDVSSNSVSRGLGLNGIMEWMSKDEIDIHIVESQKSFVVEMHIPISLFYFEGGDQSS